MAAETSVNPADQLLPLTETTVPDDQAAVAETVRKAWGPGTPVYPIGGATSLDYGVRPTLPGLGLTLARLNRVIDYPARDLTITVEAGLTIAELAGRLAAERQRLPVDIPQADRATVGGVVATSPSGPRRYRYGTLRDYVIGIQAVDGRGTAFSAGGRVVKNAAGYDLCRLLTGSLGTIGVITQVTLMVKPMPETSAFLACHLDDWDAAERLLADLVHTETLPAAIELLVGPAWQDEPALPAESQSCAGRLAVGFEGISAEVDWMLQRLDAEWSRAPDVSPAAIRGEACTRLWHRLREFPAEKPAPEGTAPLVAQIIVLPSVMVEFVRLLLRVDPDCSIQAHAGNGVICVRFSPDAEQRASLISDRLRPAVAEAGGSMVVLSAPAGLELSREQVWGRVGDGAAVMQTIKTQFDPKGILNPDRFLFGSRPE